MEITEVRIFPKEGVNNRLRAYATITIDNAFVVRNIKVIEGKSGLFVAMPSKKMQESCPRCKHKNDIKSKYCNECGNQLPIVSMPITEELSPDVRHEEHRDIAHPITTQARDYIQTKVLGAYEGEKSKVL